MKERILIVDDKTMTGREISSKLSRHDYEVVGQAKGASQALVRVEELDPDLVLMDLELEDELDGLEAAARIEESFSVPIVLMTDRTDFETTREAKQIGPAGYLAKPVDAEELFAVLEIALHRHRQLEKRLQE